FSPLAQWSIFRSAASQSLVFNPATGPVMRLNTPAIMAFRFTPNGGTQQFNVPSISVLSNLNGSTAALNTVTPQFLTGNFNFTIPFNGMFSIAVPNSNVSANATASGLAMNSAAAQMAASTGLTRAQ